MLDQSFCCTVRHEGGNICVSTWRGTPFACPIGCEVPQSYSCQRPFLHLQVSEVPPLCQTPTGHALEARALVPLFSARRCVQFAGAVLRGSLETGRRGSTEAHPRHPCGEYPHQNHPAEAFVAKVGRVACCFSPPDLKAVEVLASTKACDRVLASLAGALLDEM